MRPKLHSLRNRNLLIIQSQGNKTSNIMSNLFGLILLLASAGLFFGFTNPLYTGDSGSAEINKRSIKELRKDEAEYREALERTAEIERVRVGLVSKYNEIKSDDREKIAKLIPDHIDTVRLLIDLSNIAKGYNMTLTSISIGVGNGHEKSNGAKASALLSGGSEVGAVGAIGPDAKVYSTFGLSFSVSGSYENLVSFVRDLEQNLRLTDITALSLSAGDLSGSVYRLDLALTTYKLKN